MNRVMLRNGSSRKSTAGLERKISTLTFLVFLQVVLLAVFLILQFVDISGLSGLRSRSGLEAENYLGEYGDYDVSDIVPVIDKPETGKLPPEVPLNRRVYIQVLNGCGVPKVAARIADGLREKGYDVRDVANADRHDYPSTLIYDRTGLTGQAQRLAQVMSVSRQRVFYREDSSLVDVDLTVIIGSDYSSLQF